ncbi:MAG: hypothetical protein CMJ83_22870 [Planctomycetes bacterium]|nr:hypothetical protein [Planctomycetota bacterium]
MPKNEPDPADPMQLTGVEIPDSGPEAVREMVVSFAAEMTWLGHDEAALLRMFRDPFYTAAHGAWQQLGEEEAGRILHAVTAVAKSRDAIRSWEV